MTILNSTIRSGQKQNASRRVIQDRKTKQTSVQRAVYKDVGRVNGRTCIFAVSKHIDDDEHTLSSFDDEQVEALSEAEQCDGLKRSSADEPHKSTVCDVRESSNSTKAKAKLILANFHASSFSLNCISCDCKSIAQLFERCRRINQ